MNLFEYQLNAIKGLDEAIGYGIDQYKVAKKRNREKTLTVHFVSPTGSGKTLMSFALIDELSKQYDNLAFIWLAPNKLHEQTLEKFEYYSDTLYSNLKPIDSDNLDSNNILNQNEILCLNWASIDKNSNTLIKENETGRYMQNIITKTKENGINIVIFIDESHIASSNDSSKANTFVESINPSIRVEITATPKKINLGDEIVEVSRKDVIDSGVIKKEFIFNDFDNESDAVNKEILTQTAYSRLRDIKQQFIAIGIDYINPLMIVQIENDNQDDLRKTQNEIKHYLEKMGISSNLIADYMSKSKENIEDLTNLNSQIEIVFTKTAIATGWDCPRASVLLTFRKSNSDDFKTQILGRINRMPELKHYGVELLDTAYVYANMEKYVPDNLTIKEFNIKTNVNKNLNKIYIKDNFKDIIQLPKYSKQSIIDYFYDSEYDLDNFVEESCKDFWDKAKQTSNKVTSKIIYDLHLKDPVIEIINSQDMDYVLSNKEIQDIFSKKLKSAGFKVSDSGFIQGSLFDINTEITPYETDRLLKTLKETSKNKVDSYLELYSLILQKDNFIYFSELLEKIINHSHKKRFRRVESGIIFEDTKDYLTWKPPTYFDCRKDTRDDIFSKNIYNKICISDYNSTEQQFAYILESDTNVQCWYKNGSKGEIFFSIPYKKDNIIKNFYPDFIVKYKDNSYGIYDTKSEMTASDGEAKEKAEYLYTYRQKHKFQGGLIKLKKLPTNLGNFVINQREEYTNYDPNNIQWEDFSDSFEITKSLFK
jgi:type III restriction enzyme